MGEAESCAFPECLRAAGVVGDSDLALCSEHRALLLDDPGEFRRLWGALDPRRRASQPHIPGKPEAPIPPARDGS